MPMCRRYKMEGIANFRDLGGYPCDGGMTRWGVFYRSTSLNKAVPEDLQVLSKLKIGYILDLRYKQERTEYPDHLAGDLIYHGISLMGPTPVSELRVNSWVEETKTLIRMYRRIIRYSKKEIAEAFRFLLRADRAALFHCAAGKDRTGVIAMLLMGAVGVSREDIVADYEISHNYVQHFTEDRSGTHRNNMELLLDEIEKVYGTVSGFLGTCGISDRELAQLRDKFVMPVFNDKAIEGDRDGRSE